MRTCTKNLCVILALSMLFVISLSQIPKAYPAELTVQDKALSAMKDIVGLDLTKYNVDLSNYRSENPIDYGGLLQEDITYSLKSGENKIDFNFRFVNKTLAIVDIYPYGNSLLSAHYAKQLPSSVLDATKEILQRIQTYADASYVQNMHDSLDTVFNIDSVNATIGNLKRQITINSNFVSQNTTSTYTSISFMYTLNGADSPKSINIRFKDGGLVGFTNGWKFFFVGNENLSVSREKAISMALEEAQAATEEVLNLRNDPIRAELHMETREPFTLYPFWFVEIPLDYPNSTITGWQVGIWGDIGKIEYSHATGIKGTVPTYTTPEPSNTQAEQENKENQSVVIYVVSAFTILSIVVAVALVALKRTHRIDRRVSSKELKHIGMLKQTNISRS